MRVAAGLAALALAVSALVSVRSMPAQGASPQVILYLEGGGVPSSAMGQTFPPDTVLPNMDPGRDSEPGLVLAKTDGGAGENDPSKYQQWEYYASGQEITFENLVLWAAMKDFDDAKTGLISVVILDCDASCSVLYQASKVVNGQSTWSRVTVPLSGEHLFPTGHSLVVKVVVDSGSDDDMWLAYGTAQFSSHLRVRSAGSSSTTTTVPPTTTTTMLVTTTTTTPTTTTTTTLPGTTTTTSVGRSTTVPTLPVSTSPSEGPEQSTTTSVPTQTDDDASDDGVILAFPGDGDPPADGSPTSLAEASSGLTVGAGDIIESTPAISPQEGLLVAFATVAQAFSTHLLPFLALAALGTLLVAVGLTGRGDETDVPDLPSDTAGGWWFSG